MFIFHRKEILRCLERVATRLASRIKHQKTGMDATCHTVSLKAQCNNNQIRISAHLDKDQSFSHVFSYWPNQQGSHFTQEKLFYPGQWEKPGK